MKINNVTRCGFGSYAQPTQGIKYGSEVSTYRVGLLFSIYTLGGLGIQPKPASGDIYIWQKSERKNLWKYRSEKSFKTLLFQIIYADKKRDKKYGS